MKNGKKLLSIREICIFAVFGALMFSSKLIMEILPNIHLLGMLVMLCTVLFRWKALFPIYVYVMINGIYSGFAMWWIPYLYVWTVLFGMTMLIPRKIPDKIAAVVYPIVCALHGFSFGILYAPAQALMYGLDFEGLVAWVAMGFSFDITHGISNFFMGMLVLPLAKTMKKAFPFI